jgi:hypothetical protein
MRTRFIVLAAVAVAATATPTFAADGPAPEPSAKIFVDREIQPAPAPDDLSNDSPTEDVIPPVAERIFELGKNDGFVSQHTDYDSRSISVVWKGPVPAAVLEYADSRPYDVRVIFTAGAKFSRGQGEAAREALLQDPIARELGIISASVNADGSGLTLGSTLKDIDSADHSRAAAAAGLKFEDLVFNTGRTPSDGYASRQNDSSPWKGGGATRHGSAGCSSGYAVLSGSAGRLLSARHCDPSANLAVKDGADQQIAPGGSSVSGKASVDSLLIDPTASPATTPKVYVGGYASSTQATVKNWYSNWPGDPVCASGAARGTHCGTIYDDNDTYYIGGTYVGVIQVKAPSGSIMAGHGDSGGPVYKSVSGGVQARGIVLGPDTDHAETYSCGSTAPWAAGLAGQGVSPLS